MKSMKNMKNMKNRRILVVDDNPSLHEDFKKILAGTKNDSEKRLKEAARELFGDDSKDVDPSLKFDLDFAFQGQEALQKVIEALKQGKPYALVFMDVRMPPGWDGIVTVAKIWDAAPFTEVVVCTAYSDYSLEDVISKLGISEHLLFLKKPFDTVEVLQIAIAQTKKWNLECENRLHVENLESLVHQKIQELEKERAKNANNLKLLALGDMAGGVAHEINSPLTTILCNVSLQKDLIEDEGADKKNLGPMADKIEASTLRISKIIKGLQTFSRTGDNDPFALESIHEIIQETIGFCGEKFKIKGTSLVFDNKITGYPKIQCRRIQMIQTFLNILNNAFEAVNGLEEKWIKIEAVVDNEEVVVSVTDSGPGIKKDVQEKLFHPFFTTKEIGKGMGLGLAISKGILEDHHGSLRFDEQSPHTRFVISIPLKRGSTRQSDVA